MTPVSSAAAVGGRSGRVSRPPAKTTPVSATAIVHVPGNLERREVLADDEPGAEPDEHRRRAPRQRVGAAEVAEAVGLQQGGGVDDVDDG